MQKLLTISVAAYNGAATLAKALESCMAPDMEQVEVIVIDDGSTDETAQIAKRYVEAFPATFSLIRQKNGGYGSTIQAALSAASGRYFRTLDCDDWFEEGSLAELLRFLRSCQADVVYTNYQTICGGTVKERFPVCEGYQPGRIYEFEMLADRTLNMEMHALTFRTEILRRSLGELPRHCSYTDMLYTFRGMAGAQTVAFCPVMLYCYLLGREGQSVSLENYQRHTKEYILVAQKILAEAEKLPAGTAKGKILRARARDVAQYMIELFLRFPPSEEVKRQLREYDEMCRKQYGNIWETVPNKNTKLLRCSGYSFYFLISRYERWKSKGVISIRESRS